MNTLLILVAILFSALLTVITFVQMLYLESLRLRSRDLPALEFFKTTLEERLGFKTEEGALSFSLVKHSLLVLVAILSFAAIIDGGHITGFVFLQSILTAWIVMILATYVLPQILYRRTSAHWLLPLAPLIGVMALLIKPLVGLLNFSHSLLDLTKETVRAEDVPTSAENIEALISAGAEEGLIEEEDRKLIQSVVAFGDRIVREVMTPRPNMVAISADSSLEQLRQLVINEQYSRIPVYENNIDEIVGFVHVRDMFELEESERVNRRVRELMRPIRFVPETKPVNDLMREMQAEGAHMVIAVDEYGNTAGLVTMEDLLEVILGEIRDEHEPDSDVTEDGEGGYIVSGSFDLTRLAEMLEFHPDAEIQSTTVGGLVTEWLGRVPHTGEVVERDGIRIEILASDELRVMQCKVRKSPVLTHPHD